MAEKTWACNKEQSIADFGTNRGNGKDDHAPIGLYSGTVFRDLMDFAYDWSGVYRIKKAFLELRTTGEEHIARGASPRVKVYRISGTWQQDGGGENSWSTTASTVWSGPAVAGSAIDSAVLATGDDKLDRIDITAIVDAWAPSTVLRSNGQAGSGTSTTRRGIRVQSYDEGSTSRTTEWFSRRINAAYKRPRIVLVYDDNAPPDTPTVRTPTPSDGGDATVVATTNGRDLTVEFDFTDPDGDLCAKAEVEVYASNVTDATAEASTPIVTSGVVTPTGTGTARRYRVALTGLTARTDQRLRLHVQDPKGAWSPWTSLDDGLITTAYQPGKPLNPSMAKDPNGNAITATLSSADPADYVTGMWVKAYRDLATGPFLLWDSGQVDVGDGSSRSITEDWGGKPVYDGDKVRWRIALANRDEVWSAFTDDQTTTLRSPTGPTITPADDSTKLLSRTASLTFTFSESCDGYWFRLYRDGELVYPGALVSISAAVSATPSLPDGYVNWGDTLEIEVAERPASTGILGPFSPRSKLYVNALPTTTTTAGDGDLEDAAVVPTTDVLWSSPFAGNDVDAYEEVPTAKELDLWVAGVNVQRRVSVSQIVEDERTGRSIDTLTSATGWGYDTNVLVTTENQQPSGYSGNSVSVQASGGSSTDRGSRYTFATPIDLSEFGGGALFSIHRRCTSVTNLTRWVLRFEFATTSDYAEYELIASGGTIDTWAEVVVAKGNPRATSGTVDWSNVEAYRFIADVSGAYTGNLQVRDLRLGLVQTAKSTPDGYIDPETTVSGRVRYLDDATPRVSTTLAASSIVGATNVKVASVSLLYAGADLTFVTAGAVEVRKIATVGTAGAGGTGVTLTTALSFAHTSGDTVRADYWGPWSAFASVKASEPPVVAADTPADKATVADPTLDLVHTYSSPGGKAQALRTTRLYRRRGQANRVITSGAATLLRLSETTSTFADSIGSVVGTLSGTATRGATGAMDPEDTDAGVDLNGSSGYITCGDVFDFTGTASFTVAVWIRPDSAAATARILSKEHATDGGWRLRYGTDESVTFARLDNASGADQTDTAVTVAVGTLARIVVTYDGSTISLYKDGELADDVASTRSLTNHSTELHIGRYAAGASGYFSGLVDDLAIWNRALSAAEVAADFAAATEPPGDVLVREDDVTGTGLTDTLPTLQLEDVTAYAWEKTAYDTDGLYETTTRRSFWTTFTAPAAIADLTATPDDDTSAVTIAWTASADTYFDHHRVYWRDAHGDWVRIDAGPRVVDDERTKLTDATLTWYGARLGVNEFLVTAHNGALESEQATVSATLSRVAGAYGQWLIVQDDVTTLGLMVPDAPRVHTAVVETFRVPGRAHPVHLHWGSTGRSATVRHRYRPAVDGDHLSPISELLDDGAAFWLKAPSGYAWDVMRVRLVGLSDSVEPYGFTSLTLDVDEVDREDV